MTGMIRWLQAGESFPPVESALAQPNGLLAAGGDLGPARLIEAYRHGIFPWYNEGQPVLWWSPDPRMVLPPTEIRITRSLAKVLRNRQHEIRVDSAFRAVMQACAEPRAEQEGTWISQDMINAYCQMHEQGMAHSVETWIDGELAGGLYGIEIGHMFFGESMFSRATDASKIALVALVDRLRERGFVLLDTQWMTPHLQQFGGYELSRKEYHLVLAKALEVDVTL
jgi:leucyl/phenylalanyl-tRNA--protein transferase